MRIVQLMTDRSRYFNPSKNYWFSFSSFLISLIGLYLWCGWFKIVVQINICNSSNPQSFGGLSPLGPLPGLCLGPTGDLKQSRMGD
jgi:hypothetical protein